MFCRGGERGCLCLEPKPANVDWETARCLWKDIVRVLRDDMSVPYALKELTADG